MERISVNKYWFSLGNGMSMETLISQFQPLCEKILCVKDGSELYFFASGAEIPPCLTYESSNVSPLTGLPEFHFRSTSDDSLYTFFSQDLSLWLRGGRVSQVPSFSGNYGVKSAVHPQVTVKQQQPQQQPQQQKQQQQSGVCEKLAPGMYKVITVGTPAVPTAAMVPAVGSSSIAASSRTTTRSSQRVQQESEGTPDDVVGRSFNVDVQQVNTFSTRITNARK